MEAKKLSILRVLQILEKYSDYEHPLTQNDILEKLRSEYDIEGERKAIGRNISYLKEAGFDIVSIKQGSYLDTRRFEKSELRLLIDAVLSSRYIDNKHSEDLIKKLINEGGEYFTSATKHIYYNKEWQKTENKSVFYNIDTLDTAIEQRKQVEISYSKYNLQKRLEKRPTPMIVNPYQLLIHNQYYYLVCNNDKYDNISYLRLDKITDIKILDTYSKPLKAISGCEHGLKLNALDTSFPYMYGGVVEKISLRCDKSIINDLVDWFGTKFSIREVDEKRIDVCVFASVQAMKYWAMQYGLFVEVLSPKSLRNDIINAVNTMQNNYAI